jgi:hypothetical protein
MEGIPVEERLSLEAEHMGMHTINRDAYEGDIASRLRNWRGLHLAHGGELFEEAAREIEMLRQQWREMSSAMMELRRENLHLKQELADSKRWAMSERAAKWDALAKYTTEGE